MPPHFFKVGGIKNLGGGQGRVGVGGGGGGEGGRGPIRGGGGGGWVARFGVGG